MQTKLEKTNEKYIYLTKDKTQYRVQVKGIHFGCRYSLYEAIDLRNKVLKKLQENGIIIRTKSKTVINFDENINKLIEKLKK